MANNKSGVYELGPDAAPNVDRLRELTGIRSGPEMFRRLVDTLLYEAERTNVDKIELRNLQLVQPTPCRRCGSDVS